MSSAAGTNPDTTGVSAWRRASTFERGIYSNLARWIARRPDLGSPGSVPIAYVGIVRMTIWVWIGASAVEMAAVHLQPGGLPRGAARARLRPAPGDRGV